MKFPIRCATASPFPKLAWTFALLFILAPALAAGAEFTVDLQAEGRESCLVNPTPEERDDGFPRLEIRGGHIGGRPCVEETKTVCVPQGCRLDTSRTHSTSTNLGGGFGQGGPGYGIFVRSVNSPGDDEFASHSLDTASGCLVSRVRVCAKRRQRGWYEGRHVLYLTCGVVERDWRHEQSKGPFQLSPTDGYQNLARYDGPIGSGGTCTTTSIDRYDVDVTSKNPPTADLQVGMFDSSSTPGRENGPFFWALNSADNDLEITALEITQGIQNVASSMPLVERRRTVVRAHARSVLAVGSVRARLRAFRAGRELPGSPLEPESLINVSPGGGDRLQLDHSFLFHLPPAWRTGVVRLLAEVDHEDRVPETDEGNNTFERRVRFHPVRDVALTTVPFHLHPDGDRDEPSFTYHQSDGTFWPIASSLLRFFPIDRMLLWDCGIPAQRPTLHGFPFYDEWNLERGLDQALILSRVMWLRGLGGCGPADQHWVGMVHPRISTRTQSGDTLGIAIPFGRSSWVKMDADGDQRIPWYSRGGATFAHELGHNEGLLHARCSGDEGFPVNNAFPHPFPSCRLAEGEDGYFGLDVYHDIWGLREPTVISNDPTASHPHRAFPLMGYRDPEWISPFHYCYLLLRDGVPCLPQLMKSSAPLASPAPVADAANKRWAGDYLLVGGVIDVAQETAEAFEVRRVARLPANLASIVDFRPLVTQRSPGPLDGWELVQLNAAGLELSRQRLQLSPNDEADPFSPLLEAVQAEPGVAKVELRRWEIVAAELSASPSPPTVTLIETGGGTLTAPWTVRWNASDPDGDPLRFNLYYSPDDGKTWRLVALGLEGNEYRLTNLRRLPGSLEGKFRIEAHDGFLTASDVSERPWIVPGSAPAVKILEAEGLRVDLGQTVQLTGVATDVDDGPITDGKRLSWSSDRDGTLARGSELHTRELSRGVHRIRLRVVDRDGQAGFDEIYVYVGIDPPEGVWTPWLDRDDPSGIGDFETHRDFFREGNVCEHPIGIECRTREGGLDWRETGLSYSCEPRLGGICQNASQGSRRCEDFEVRFLCLEEAAIP